MCKEIEHEYRELRPQQRQTQLAEHLPAIQSAATKKANEFVADSLYNEDGLPENL
jgi:hypothetical protein